MSRLGDEIHRERLKRGLSTKEIAKKSGISENFLISVESGKKIVNDSVAMRILKLIGATPRIIDDFEEETEQSNKTDIISSDKNKGKINARWQEALSGIFKKVPVFDINMKAVDYKMMPIHDGKIEGYNADKVFYVKADDNSIAGFRIQKGDLIFVAPVHEIVNDAIMVVKYNDKTTIRKLKKIDSNKVLLMSNDRQLFTESADINNVSVLGKCQRVEFKL